MMIINIDNQSENIPYKNGMNLAENYPLLVKEWHPDNGPIQNYSAGSGKKVQWICSIILCGCHIWEASIASRAGKTKTGCPFCAGRKTCLHNNLATNHPELVDEWHSDNGSMENFAAKSSKKVQWICPDNICGCHIYEACINNRTKTNCTGCPFCSGRSVCCHSSLLAKYPELCKEWDYSKNIILPQNIHPGSSKIVWWICSINPCGCHSWETTISSRTKQIPYGCPFCSNRRVCEHNNLLVLRPELCKEWDYVKNINDPSIFAVYSQKKAWWICIKSICGCHSWEARISSRTSGHNSGCPYCVGQKMCEHTSISATHPDLCKEWDYDKNDQIPTEFTKGSHHKVWWICPINQNNHSWKAQINSRVRGTGCPYCKLKTEQKLYDALSKIHPNLIRGYSVNWCKNINCLPFDFVLKEERIIIELDGKHHFYQAVNWSSPDTIRKTDAYKMFCANNNGYSVIRILQDDVWNNKYDWLECIVEYIQILLFKEQVRNVYICKYDEYKLHKRCLGTLQKNARCDA